MQPIPFTLEAFQKDIADTPWGFFNFAVGCPGSLPRIPNSGPSPLDSDPCEADAPQPPAAPLPMQEPLSAACVGSDSHAASDTVSEADMPDMAHLMRSTWSPLQTLFMHPAPQLTPAPFAASARSQWQPVLHLSSKHTLCRRQACV